MYVLQANIHTIKRKTAEAADLLQISKLQSGNFLKTAQALKR